MFAIYFYEILYTNNDYTVSITSSRWFFNIYSISCVSRNYVLSGLSAFQSIAEKFQVQRFVYALNVEDPELVGGRELLG